jgi:hypothetical protein
MKIYYPSWLAYAFVRKEIVACNELMFKPVYKAEDPKAEFKKTYTDWVYSMKEEVKGKRIFRHVPENLEELKRLELSLKGGKIPIWLYTKFYEESDVVSPQQIQNRHLVNLRKYKVFEGLTSDNSRLKTIAFFQYAYEARNVKFDLMRFINTMDKIMIDEEGELEIKLKTHEEEAPNVALICLI